ncbi:MAG: DNA polymerase/3'-5' exonuclease PolX, partial [Actinomycetota bacterium]
GHHHVQLMQRQDRETITARVLAALATGVIDILAHPTGRILGMRDATELDLERVLDAAVTHRVALEINAAADRLDLNEVYARQAKDLGIPITINTDAHSTRSLGACDYGIAQARRAWLEPDDVINTWELPRLMDWLHHRQSA